MLTSSPGLTVRTRPLRSGDPRHDRALLDWLPTREALCWVQDGAGLVGWGEAARLDTSGPDRFAEAEQWWQELCERFVVDDPLRLPGTGPLAFASFAFADTPGRSSVIVPSVVVGCRDGQRWVTTISAGEEPDVDPARDPERGPGLIRYSDGQVPTTGFRAAVSEAVRRMQSDSGIRKIVLAHDRRATSSQPLDSRFLLRTLAERYANCWTFAVDGLIGATPELLLERAGARVRSRVLAGTMWPRDGLSADELADQLLDSAKNQDEHAYAINSLAETLRPHCRELTVPTEPHVMRLRNVMHLASDVSGTLDSEAVREGKTSLLRLVDAVHPTAAVGGTPTPEAVRAIGELERMDRRGYAGPVGWLDADGNGEFGIALRCAQIEDERTARLYAGGGIVADSDPDMEVAEAEAKMLPVREALEGVR